MKYERYTELLVTKDYLEFEFNSIGPKGSIRKLIQFTETPDKSIVNLAFGNKLEDGSIDDLARDDNKDRNKILATVVTVVKLYFGKYPDKCIFFKGSSPERTRLYRMAITINLEELSIDFEIIGTLTDKHTSDNVPFEKGINFLGFLVKPKKRNFKDQFKILVYETERERTTGERTDD